VAGWFHFTVESENCVKYALTDIDLRQQEGALLTKCSAIVSYQLLKHLYYLFNMPRLPTQFRRKIVGLSVWWEVETELWKLH